MGRTASIGRHTRKHNKLPGINTRLLLRTPSFLVIRLREDSPDEATRIVTRHVEHPQNLKQPRVRTSHFWRPYPYRHPSLLLQTRELSAQRTSRRTWCTSRRIATRLSWLIDGWTGAAITLALDSGTPAIPFPYKIARLQGTQRRNCTQTLGPAIPGLAACLPSWTLHPLTRCHTLHIAHTLVCCILDAESVVRHTFLEGLTRCMMEMMRKRYVLPRRMIVLWANCKDLAMTN